MSEHKATAKQRGAGVALAVLAGALGTALIGGVLWMAFRPSPHPTPEPTDSAVATATAEPTVAAPAPTTPVAEAPTTPASAPTTATGASGGTQAPVDQTSDSHQARSAKFAYRKNGKLYIASESGSGKRAVASSGSGPYALSPDAARLAWIDGGKLRVYTTATKKTVVVGEADASLPPRWFGDAGLVYRVRTGDSAVLRKLPKAASTSGAISEGAEVAASEDGRILVVRDDSGPLPDGSTAVRVSVDGGAFKAVRVAGGAATALAVSGGRIIVGLAASDRGSAVVSLKPDGTDQRSVTGAVPGTSPAVWVSILPSPNGATLALEAQGDDGYSRTFTVPATGGALRALVNRLDSALHGWTASGARILLVEGNAFQGEATDIVSVNPDGTGHRTVVEGAE